MLICVHFCSVAESGGHGLLGFFPFHTELFPTLRLKLGSWAPLPWDICRNKREVNLTILLRLLTKTKLMQEVVPEKGADRE